MREVEPALVRHVGIGIQGDVRDVHRVLAEPVRLAQVPLHDRERGAPALLLVRKLHALRPGHLDMPDPVARDRDAGLVAVLLEEHPLQGEGATERFGREEARTLGEMEEDRVGLGEMRTVLKLQHRDTAVGVAGEELRCPRLALEDVDLDSLVSPAQVGEQQPRLVSIAGKAVVVEAKHRRVLGDGRERIDSEFCP